MHKALYLLATLALALTGCDTLTQQRLAGTYQYTGKKDSFHPLYRFELTGDKFITHDFLGETAMDYTVEDGSIYVQAYSTQYRFQVVSADTLRNDGGMGMLGTYVRVK